MRKRGVNRAGGVSGKAWLGAGLVVLGISACDLKSGSRDGTDDGVGSENSNAERDAVASASGQLSDAGLGANHGDAGDSVTIDLTLTGRGAGWGTVNIGAGDAAVSGATSDGSTVSSDDSTSSTAADQTSSSADITDRTDPGDTTDPTVDIILILAGGGTSDSSDTQGDASSDSTDTASSDTASSDTTSSDTASSDTTSSTDVGSTTRSDVQDAGGAETGGSVGMPDAATMPDAGTHATPIAATVSATADWVDLPASFGVQVTSPMQGSQLTFVWQLTSIPSGSEASLDSTSGESVSFTPDVAGVYQVQVTVAAGDASEVFTSSARVEAVNIAYIALSQPQGSDFYAHTPRMVSSDRQTDTAVGCAFDTSTMTGQESQYWTWQSDYYSGNRSLATYYPATPGQPSQMAYRLREQGSFTGVTQVATAATDCVESPPVTLPAALIPVFSPSGERLAYLNEETQAVETASATASLVRTVASQGSVGGLAWDGESSVALSWYEPEQSFGLAVSPDAAESDNAPVTNLADCSGIDFPFYYFDQFVVRDSFVLLYEYGQLWFLPRVDGLVSCDRDDAQNRILSSAVEDFALSPDGQTLAMLTANYRTETRAAQLVMGPVDGSAWTTVELGAETTDFGLSWIAGNKQLAWTSLKSSYAYDVSGAYYQLYDSQIWRINADGSHLTPLVTESSDSETLRLVVTGSLPNVEYGYGM